MAHWLKEEPIVIDIRKQCEANVEVEQADDAKAMVERMIVAIRKAKEEEAAKARLDEITARFDEAMSQAREDE